MSGDGRVAPKLDPDKQGKHVSGHRNHIPGRGALSDPNPRLLPDDRAGTGTPVNDLPIGAAGSKERVAFGKVIGDYVDRRTGRAMPTCNGIIVYERRGNAHIIPFRP